MLDPKDEIKQRLDIVEVIREYLPLKPAGSGGFKACCPFHSEKTPSFHVSKEKQIWHCFGCNKGGDLFAFIMDMEGLSFPETLELTAAKAGVKLPERIQNEETKIAKKERDIMLDLHVIAQKFYAKILLEHVRGARALTYLTDRGVTKDLINNFELGFAPDEWSMLSNFLKKRGYSEKSLIKSGLSKERKKGDGIIDRFRNRILVPLHDDRGRVIGFTGRVLEETEKSGPKYLNSPETEIYNKRGVLYGLHLAKTAIRREKSVIIVEGNLDVIASHKAGVEHIVASSGTALTEIQLRTLKKLTNKLIFCFDADNAGYEAAKRGMDLAQGMGFDIRVIQISTDLGKDPDDVVQKDPAAWQSLVKKNIHSMEYYFSKEFDRVDLSDPAQKSRAVEFIESKIALIPDIIEREHWLMQLSDRTMIDIQILRNKLRGFKPETVSKKPPHTEVKKKAPESKNTKAVRFLLGILLNTKEFGEMILDELREEHIQDGELRTIYKDVKEVYNQHKSSSNAQKSFFSILDTLYTEQGQDGYKAKIAAISLKNEQTLDGFQENQVREEIERHLHILSQAPKQQHLLELERTIRQAEMSGDKERARQLTDEYLEVLRNNN